jgi:ABC-type branched-subunit amino acid transport system substrate-binding protein
MSILGLARSFVRSWNRRRGGRDIRETYTPFGFFDWQTEVAAIKAFGSAGKKTAVVSTINGDANIPLYKELGNQGVKASDIPVIAFSIGEEELKGIDNKPLVGHLAAWSYFQSVKSSENTEFISRWRAYTKDPKRVTNDPMESAYDLFQLWTQAVAKAGSIRCRQGEQGDHRPEGPLSDRIRRYDESQPPSHEACDDRRDQSVWAIRDRLKANRFRQNPGIPCSRKTRVRT